MALHLEAALDAERQGDLGAALAAYGSVIALDPDRLEAWTGVRRVARAGGDLLGEARALARLGVLVRDPRRAAALLADAAGAYESAGRDDDAIAVLSRAVELCPDDAEVYARVHALLAEELAAPGRAATFDGLLSYRLAAGTLTTGERIALLFERAQHRLTLLEDRQAAFHDFKQILKISPNDLAALHELARGALADEDPQRRRDGSSATWRPPASTSRTWRRPPSWTWPPATRRAASPVGPSRRCAGRRWPDRAIPLRSSAWRSSSCGARIRKRRSRRSAAPPPDWKTRRPRRRWP